MDSEKLKAAEVSTRDLTKRFITLPFRIYRDNPFWVAPLNVEIKEKLDKKKNPFFKYGDVKLLGVTNSNGEIVGRLAAVINPVHNQIYKDKTGFFGLFECVNDYKAAAILIKYLKEYLTKKGMDRIVGPVNFTTNDEAGILVKNFSDSPMIMSDYSPPYYDNLLKSCGFQKAVDLYSYEGFIDHLFPGKYHNANSRALSNPCISFRTFRKENLYEDSMILRALYNESFNSIWGFVPLNEDESMLMADTFTKFYDKELIWIAYYKDKPVGFVLALPDINSVLLKLKGKLFPFGFLNLFLNKGKIDSIRVLTLGVLKEYRSLGIGSLLIEKIRTRMFTAGYKKAEMSVVLENNYSMRRVLENLGFVNNKTYRIYKTEI